MDEFFAALELEATGAGFTLDARALLASVGGRFGARPHDAARDRTHPRRGPARRGAHEQLGVARGRRGARTGCERLAFDVVVESSVEGLRKPDPKIYQLVLDRLGVEATASVFLDDLGINLKPARAMGMTTIKVTDPDDALVELEQVLGFSDPGVTEGGVVLAPMRTMLQCRDLDETINFYTQMLDFTLDATWGPEPDGPPTWCSLDYGPAGIMFTHGALDDAGGPALTGSLYFYPENVDLLLSKHSSSAVRPPCLAPMDREYGMRDFALEDPERLPAAVRPATRRDSRSIA